MIEIIDPGPLTTVQDAGRPGLANLGVGASGAADMAAYRLGNRLVGNPPGLAVLELTLGGLVLRLRRSCLLALTGAPCPTSIEQTGTRLVLDLGDQQPAAVPAGSVVSFGRPPSGLRTYLAVRGGVDVAPVLGSRSTDLLAGLGPPPLRRGDVFEVGYLAPSPVPTVAAPRRACAGGPIALWQGPRRHWFEAHSIEQLSASPYTVESASNRIGLRLSGTPLVRRIDGELPSEGVVEGAVQVPADGQPIVFLADHPTTGGYPVIGVVDPDDIGRLAQARPGETLSFRWTETVCDRTT